MNIRHDIHDVEILPPYAPFAVLAYGRVGVRLCDNCAENEVGSCTLSPPSEPRVKDATLTGSCALCGHVGRLDITWDEVNELGRFSHL